MSRLRVAKALRELKDANALMLEPAYDLVLNWRTAGASATVSEVKHRMAE